MTPNSPYGLPRNVSRFERLFYASFALGIGNMALDATWLAAKPEVKAVGAGVAGVVIGGLLILAFLILFVWLAARRRKNWARWVITVMTVAGLPFAFPQYLDAFANNLTVGVIMVVQVLLQILALVFVFTGDAPPWYQKPAKGTADVVAR